MAALVASLLYYRYFKFALAFNVFVNLLSPNIHTRILESDFIHFLDELVVRILIKRSKYFPVGDHFVELINIFP